MIVDEGAGERAQRVTQVEHNLSRPTDPAAIEQWERDNWGTSPEAIAAQSDDFFDAYTVGP